MATKKPAARAVAIYTLRHPLTGEVRYVGKTNNPKARLQGHRDASKVRSHPVGRWIRKLAASGLEPVMVIEREVDEGAWVAAEIEAIASYRAAGARLLNVTAGGEGATGVTLQGNPHAFVKRVLLLRLGRSARRHRDAGRVELAEKMAQSVAVWRQFTDEHPEEALEFVLGNTLLRNYCGVDRAHA